MEQFKTFINSQINEDIDDFVTIKRFAKSAEREIIKYLEDEIVMLDHYAISEIASEYKKCVDLIHEMDFTAVQLMQTVGLHFQRLKETVRKIVQDSNNRRCPNKQGANSCGLMVQTYVHCDTCLDEKIICAGGLPVNQEYFDRCSCVCIDKKCTDLKTGHKCSPCRDQEIHISETIDCGERNIEVAEDEDLILDCSFPWHSLLGQPYKNNFVRLFSSVFPFSPFIELESKVIEEPYIEMKGVQKKDEGMYMCSTILQSDVPVSKIIYHVKVVKGPARTTERYKPRPTLPNELDITTPELPFIQTQSFKIILVAGGITILLIAGICICICVYRFKKMKEQDSRTSIV
ncbi:izumo sperm-egg fusion protein 1-like [Anomaloglossus baeobatrachus]|uniref:izumo sperm-egg fusion protein 1-like n=1 Tax=Anomaloglossus baeobatrachus TaxID=238106 RepID=UPI003F5035A1